jgi:hypothetical protein
VLKDKQKVWKPKMLKAEAYGQSFLKFPVDGVKTGREFQYSSQEVANGGFVCPLCNAYNENILHWEAVVCSCDKVWLRMGNGLFEVLSPLSEFWK